MIWIYACQYMEVRNPSFKLTSNCIFIYSNVYVHVICCKLIIPNITLKVVIIIMNSVTRKSNLNLWFSIIRWKCSSLNVLYIMPILYTILYIFLLITKTYIPISPKVINQALNWQIEWIIFYINFGLISK